MTAAGLVCLVVAAVFVGIAALHGAIGASRNDDWTYFRSAYAFAAKGSFTPDTATTMLVGHDILAWPVIKLFGPEIAPLQIMVAGLGAIGLWAAYLVIRSFLSPGWSAFSVGCLALGPVYGILGTSFMTDIPSFTLEMLTLLAGLLALRKRDLAIGWYAASMVAGAAAFSIREFAVAAPVAVCVAAVLRARTNWARAGWKVVALTGLCLAVVAAMYVWRNGYADSGAVPFWQARDRSAMASADSTIAVSLRAAFTLTLFVAPLVPLISVRRLARSLVPCRNTAVLGGLVVCAAWASLMWLGEHVVLLGNYLTQSGSYSVTIPGTPPVVIPSGWWTGLEILSLVTLLVLGSLALVRAGGPTRPENSTKPRSVASLDPGRTLVALFCTTSLGVLGALVLFTNSTLFDRYLVPTVPFAVALSVRAARDHRLFVRRQAVVATMSLVAFAGFGIRMVDASATFDGAKWQLAHSVEARGYDAASIDGGYEWYGYHQPGPIAARANVPGTNFWVSFFGERRICVTAQFEGPIPTGPTGTKAAVVSELGVRSLAGVKYDLIAVARPHPCPVTR